MTDYITNGDKKLAEMCGETSSVGVTLQDHNQMNRFDKMEFLRETTTVDTYTKNILEEMVSWMGEEDFSRFYDSYCSNWDISRSYAELNERYGD